MKVPQTNVSLEPPQILVSTRPAILAILDGEPIPADIEKASLKKVVNTNWDLYIDKSDRLYLRDGKSWLSARGLDEAWSPVTKMPKNCAKLPETECDLFFDQPTSAIESRMRPANR